MRPIKACAQASCLVGLHKVKVRSKGPSVMAIGGSISGSAKMSQVGF